MCVCDWCMSTSHSTKKSTRSKSLKLFFFETAIRDLVVLLFHSLGPTEHTLVVLLWFLDIHTTHRQLEGMVIACFGPFLT